MYEIGARAVKEIDAPLAKKLFGLAINPAARPITNTLGVQFRTYFHFYDFYAQCCSLGTDVAITFGQSLLRVGFMIKILRRAAAVLFCVACGSGHAAEFPDYHFVHTSGEAFLYVAPDNAEISFDLKAIDPDAELAFSRVTARIAELQALLTEQALPDALSVGEVYREQLAAKDGNPESAVLKCTVRIKMEDLAKWKAVIEPVLKMKDLEKLNVFFDTTQRDEIENQLLIEAGKNARKRADVMARSFGRQVTTASAITDGQLRNITAAIGLVTSNANTSRVKRMQAAAELSSITTLKFAKSVDVVFRTK